MKKRSRLRSRLQVFFCFHQTSGNLEQTVIPPPMSTSQTTHDLDQGIEVRGDVPPDMAHIVSPEALAFIARLHRRFDSERQSILSRRLARQAELDAGALPRFLPETAHIRDSDWTVAPIPDDLKDRRVEITGPVDRKMIINALNSGANVFMADFEDSNSPSWSNNLSGQANLYDAVRGTIDFTHPATGKHYALNESTATLVVRPRGWHLLEKHILVDGQPVSASLFDFGLYFFHNAKASTNANSGPYFYLPKLESHLEARLWNQVFDEAQDALEIPRGTIRATVLIETILAAFEMHEILWELKEHSAGLNCGRWDSIFSFIKRFQANPSFVLPDRGLVGMTQHFLRSYSQLLIQTCHRRGIHAMGGMAAQIPIKGDDDANQAALDRVTADKQREAEDGHDGTWVAHPALVQLAKNIFDDVMPEPHQISKQRDDVDISADDLLTVPEGQKTEAGLRQNVNVGILYLEAWLGGTGCVPLYHLMEDAATAEISRTQLWQWIQHGACLDDGRTITKELFHQILEEEKATIKDAWPAELPHLDVAADLFDRLITNDTLEEFLTLPAYDHLIRQEN